MTEFMVSIACEGDAFRRGNETRELARLLAVVAERLKEDGLPEGGMTLRDVNGNRVGHAGWLPAETAAGRR